MPKPVLNIVIIAVVLGFALAFFYIGQDCVAWALLVLLALQFIEVRVE